MVVRIFQLIKQDVVVLYPAMIASFLSLWISKLIPADPAGTPEIIGLRLLLVLGTSTLLSIFIQLFTAECARQIVLRPVIFVGEALRVSLLRYIPALIFSGLLGGVLFLLGILSAQIGLWGVVLVPLLLLLGLAVQIFPSVYVLSAVPVYRIYGLIYIFIRRNFRRALQLFYFFCSTSILVNMLTFTLDKYLPANLAAVLVPLLSGFGSVLLVYGIVLLLLGNNKISELV